MYINHFEAKIEWENGLIIAKHKVCNYYKQVQNKHGNHGACEPGYKIGCAKEKHTNEQHFYKFQHHLWKQDMHKYPHPYVIAMLLFQIAVMPQKQSRQEYRVLSIFF